MSILIKGVDVPKCCADCDDDMLRIAIGCPLFASNGKHENCPLVEVPTPHGRLMDADELERRYMFKDEFYCEVDNDTMYLFISELDSMPTVIESED